MPASIFFINHSRGLVKESKLEPLELFCFVRARGAGFPWDSEEPHPKVSNTMSQERFLLWGLNENSESVTLTFLCDM